MLKECAFELHRNEQFGFFSVTPLPSKQELAEFYEQLYYQGNTGQYNRTYSKEEHDYFQIECHILEYLYERTFVDSKRRSFLDVGCGEGFQADFFFQKDWQVTCVDYSDFGLGSHHPHLVASLIKGEFESAIEKLASSGERYSVILLKNILEHAIDPSVSIELLKTVMDSETLLCIDVPNDYSKFHQYLLDNDFTGNTWFVPPQHLHYFQFDSLRRLLQSHGLEIVSEQAEFEIQQFLVNENSNYAKHPESGKAAHLSRCRISNFLLSQGVEKYVDLRESSARLEFGRGISMIVRLSDQ